VTLRIILADDHPIMLEGLRALFEREPDMEIVGLAHTGREAAKLAEKLAPDLVIMDVSMPDLNGIEATRQILARNPDMKIIALTIHSDTRYALEMIRAGAKGYILKQCAYEEIKRAVRCVMKGEAYLSPGITGSLLFALTGPGPAAESGAFSTLSPREREVLQLLAEGKTSRDIASYLNISIKTVDTHKMNILHKLGLKTLAELVRYAIREGMVEA
jgi:two-component system, NarL family, response regulator NreC